MSKYGNYLKKRKESGNDFYFGEGKWKKHRFNGYLEVKKHCESSVDSNILQVEGLDKRNSLY